MYKFYYFRSRLILIDSVQYVHSSILFFNTSPLFMFLYLLPPIGGLYQLKPTQKPGAIIGLFPWFIGGVK